MTTIVERIGTLSIGRVETVTAEELRIALFNETPQATALNTGTPTGFPRINAYMLIPNETGAVVAVIKEISIVRAKPGPGKHDEALVDLPFPARTVIATPFGTLLREGNDGDSQPLYALERGVPVLPSVGDPVLLPTAAQLRSIVEAKTGDRLIQIGSAPFAGNARVWVHPDKLFGRHLAVLGNTGSGKSCSVAGIVRWSLESAAAVGQDNKGLDDRQINLGVVQPGERPAIFGDALRRLANNARFMHGDLGRYWYSMSASLNRLAADRAGQIEEPLVLLEIDKALATYINGLGDRGHFDAVQVAPSSSSDVPDEAGGVRAVVLGVAHPHTGRENSDAMAEAKDILLQRGSTPRVYRNMLVFLAAESRQLDGLKEAMRSSLAWAGIVKDTDRLNLTQRDSALAKAKVAEATETLKTRLKETWCYLLYPVQDSAQADVEWIASKVPAQDGLLSRASKKLASDEGLLPELGPARLDRELQKYIWNGKGHLSLRDLWEYLNRYIYLPRVKDRNVLIKAVRAAVGAMVPGPFAYAERWDEKSGHYIGLVLQNAANAPVVIDSDSVIVKPEMAEKQALETAAAATAPSEPTQTPTKAAAEQTGLKPTAAVVQPDRDPTRFIGTVMISADRPAHEMRQIVEAIIEQLTVLPGSEVTLKLEIDAEVPNGLDRSKVRTLLENANTLGFIDKVIK